MDNILDQLRRDEGVRSNPYKDSRGILTVGVGHNLESNPLPNEQYPLSDARIDEILTSDVARITGKLIAKLPWVNSLDDSRKGVLINMSFNMGVGGLLAFKHTLAAVQSGDYAGAANGMQSSAWYTQVGARAQRLVKQMQTGIWQ
jgi:lysozyme